MNKKSHNRRKNKFLPPRLLAFLQVTKQNYELSKLNHSGYDESNLLPLDEANINSVFSNGDNHHSWEMTQNKIADLNLPELSGGVNKGDQQAVFYLVNHFKPMNVLEIGTHLGCSTTMITLGLQKEGRMTTVDLRDVNDKINKPWIEFGGSCSPLELISELESTDRVNFVTSDSLEFLSTCKEKFDFIFLDGSHAAAIVFQEIPRALKLLNKNGILLLHDYFPNLKPLWDDNSYIPGPYLAVNKILKQNKNLRILPLGELPWETKFNSHSTSLALLTKSSA